MSSSEHIIRFVGALFLLWAGSIHAENVDPDALGLHWAWSENAGWVDAQPGGPGAHGLHAENRRLSGWMWSPNVGWISASCRNTSSCSDVAFGLNLQDDPVNPGWLRIMGHAWSENAGWIVSHCATNNSCAKSDFGLRVELSSGLVKGYAWSENLGWMSFDCANTATCGKVNFGLQFDPDGLLPGEGGVFEDSFESGLK